MVSFSSPTTFSSSSDESDNQDESPRSPLSSKFSWRRKSSIGSTVPLIRKFSWKKSIGLMEKPLADIEVALKTIKTLRATISRLADSLKPLVSEADTVLQSASRPHCGICSDNMRCTLKNTACRLKFEKFDRLIKAGGPFCNLSKHPLSGSSTSQCPSSTSHDHLHITNHHRLFLESLQVEFDALSAIYCRLASAQWFYRTMPSRLHEKKKQSNSKTVAYWSDIGAVQKDYGWVWGCQINFGSWEEFENTCQNVIETLVGIEEANRRMAIYSARVGMGEMEERLREWEVRWRRANNSVRMPISERERPSPVKVEEKNDEKKKDENPGCSWCVEYGGPRGDAIKMRPSEGGEGEPEFYVMLRGRIERLKRRVSTNERKQKGRSEDAVSEEEERELYGMPLLRERCKDCLEYELYEEATRTVSARSRNCV